MQKIHFLFDELSFAEVIAHGGGTPILTRRVLNKSVSESCNFLDFSILPPGSDIGIHTHTNDNEEFYIIVSGSGRMYSDGEYYEVSAGDVIVNRPGGTHALRNTSENEIRMVVIEVPVSLKS